MEGEGSGEGWRAKGVERGGGRREWRVKGVRGAEGKGSGEGWRVLYPLHAQGCSPLQVFLSCVRGEVSPGSPARHICHAHQPDHGGWGRGRGRGRGRGQGSHWRRPGELRDSQEYMSAGNISIFLSWAVSTRTLRGPFGHSTAMMSVGGGEGAG